MQSIANIRFIVFYRILIKLSLIILVFFDEISFSCHEWLSLSAEF